jgi:hypothetical protein
MSKAADIQNFNNLTSNEQQEADEALKQPLLYGGQSELNCKSNNKLRHPRGDISQRASDQGKECQQLSLERDRPACPAANSPAFPAVQSRHTRKSCGSSTGINVPPIPERAVTTPSRQGREFKGLKPPTLQATGALVLGKEIKKLRLQNKRTRHALQDQQQINELWSKHMGTTRLLTPTPLPEQWRGDMCPLGIATSHPAGELLSKWAQMGCPTRTGRQ